MAAILSAVLYTGGDMRRTGADDDANDRTLIERRDPLIGTTLDHHFRINFALAAGGFGAIYHATDLRTDAEVALKVLKPQLANDPMVVERFRREATMLANLRDPHTIVAYDLGEADGTLYIVMELLHGESLYERFRAHGPLPWRRVAHIARGVCSSLAEAHALGVVHRDLKPANIHLETRGNDPDFAKVLDFGIAKIVQGGGHEHNELTQAGHMVGTVDYMSPEQMVGGELTARSDIYTLGVVIYEMVSGRTPFAHQHTLTATLSAVLTQAPEPLSLHAQVPVELDEIVARCLEIEPHNRYPDVIELGHALDAVELRGMTQAGPAASLAALEHTVRSPRLGLAVQTADRTLEQPVPTFPHAPPTLEQTAPFSRPDESTPAPAAAFHRDLLTNEATRVDVHVSDSHEPVIDARGPRYRTPVRGSGHPPPVSARGSQPILSYPVVPAPSAREPVPALDLARPDRPFAMRHGTVPPPPSAVPPRQPPARSYREVIAQETVLRRILWVVLFLAATLVTVLATR